MRKLTTEFGRYLLVTVLLGTFVACTVADDKQASAKKADKSSASNEKASANELIAIIDAIEKGWENGDGTPFRKHFLDFDGARYIESGGQNEGLTDLVEHHVEPEGHALADFDLNLSNIETHIEGDFAWAIADVELTATIVSDNRYLHKRGYETFLFHRVAGQWKVIHTHSSTRAVRKD